MALLIPTRWVSQWKGFRDYFCT